MRVPFLDIPAQHAEVAETLEPNILQILRSGAYVVGTHNRELENEIAGLHGVDYAVAVNSGTDALRIALQAMGIGPGDEVITTAFTFVATIETIIQVGAIPKFVDIDPVSFQMNPALIEAAITPNTKALCPVHLYGQMCDMSEIKRVAEAHNLTILEDAAQAMLSSAEGVFAGNWGEAAALSFYVTKNLGAAGDGGMILTNDKEIHEKSVSLRIHGMGRERYYYDSVGYTSRMAEIQAAVLRAKLTRLGYWTEVRQAIAAKYNAALTGGCVITPQTLPGNNHTWHQYTIRSSKRDRLQAHLKANEIDSMIYYPVPLHYHEPYRYLGYRPGDLPETERACLECLSLPVHQHMSPEQVQFVIDTISSFE